eukprot:202067_1
MALSCGSNQKIYVNIQMDEAVQCLISNGFKPKDARSAIVSAEYNISAALQILIPGNKKSEPSNDYTTLISMGFDRKLACQTVRFARSKNCDLEVAIGFLIQYTQENKDEKENAYLSQSSDQCRAAVGSVKTCEHLEIIQKILESTHRHSIESHDNLDVVSILNSFHHLLNKHRSNNEFEDIYHALGPCDVSMCDNFRRNRRDRNIEEKSDDDEYSVICDILDKIHCYFKHSFDTGFRLNSNERKQMEVLSDEIQYATELFQVNALQNKKLCEITKLIQSKHKVIKQFMRPISFQKFNTLNDSVSSKYDTYAFGESYVYWEYDFHDNAQQFDYNQDLVQPKFAKLKDELILNALNTEQWNSEYSKATIHQQSYKGKKMVFDHKRAQTKGRHDVFAGVKIFKLSNSAVTIQHLICIIIYCGYDKLSYEFSKTYRTLKDEDKMSMKKNHSKFYHFAKLLNELVHAYSVQAYQSNTWRAYHGMNKTMKFKQLNFHSYQPFSTTSCYEVAVNFANYTGMVIELDFDGYTRFFDCAWISPYPNEHELFFINTRGLFQFANIIDVPNSCNYDELIKALCILDVSMNGGILHADRKLHHNIMNEQFFPENKSELELFGAKPIDPMLKLCTIALIKHELNRYKPTQYDKMESLSSYFDELLHFICSEKSAIRINLDLWTTEMTDEITNGGYNGCLFMRSLFFKEDLECVDLEFIVLLFPSLTSIQFENFPSKSSGIFDYILDFLRTGNRKALEHLRFQQKANANLVVNKYCTAFQSIGWSISIPKRRNPDQDILLIKESHLQNTTNSILQKYYHQKFLK